MEIRTGSVLFSSLRGAGPRTASQTLVFPRTVLQAAVGLAGYSAGFSGSDHHLGLFSVVATHLTNANTVTVTVNLGVRDWSGDWDDSYEGTVRFSVLAELEAASAPPRRTDLTIIDAEFTQAIQFFRSDRHLDPGNVRPDNSVPLFSGKGTGVRLYLDCDTASAVPAVSSVAGEVRLRTPSGATAVVPAIQAITPRREAQINRGLPEHTLNFLIPEVWCRGTLDLTFEVFDPADPLRRSQPFERTLEFIDVAPLRVFCVGVAYTGQGLDVAAPAQSAFSASLSWTEKVYPIGEALITGYTTLPFDTDMRVSGDGCGDGFGGILDALRDMRGSSSDIYVALLQAGAGIDASIDDGTSSVDGCGGGGVAAAFSGGSGRTLAQEIGHAFGRDHAPCDDPMRCGDPANQDDAYPHYGTYPSDSIGEFGFDPTTNTVFNPADSFDFMGYSGHPWVSPYTYTSLRPAFPSFALASPKAARHKDAQPAAAVAAPRPPRGGLAPERSLRTRPYLFLRLTIARDRKVQLEPSFHYEAEEASVPRGHASGFTAEFQDAGGNVLSCPPLMCSCVDCDGDDCWPKSIRAQVPFPPKARRLVVYEGDTVIFEEEIGDPPKVSVHCEPQDKQTVVSWSVDDEAGDLWFLLQWQDKTGLWRGVGPRTQEQKMILPVALTMHRKQLELRLLACGRIATGETAFTCEPAGRPAPPTGEIYVHPAGDVLSARVVGSDGAADPTAELSWFDEHGAELSHGKSLDLRRLAKRPEWLRVAVVNEQQRVPPTLLRLEHPPGQDPQVVGVYPDQAKVQAAVAGHPGKPDHHHD